MSMPLTQSGPLKRLIIAAEFDVTVSSGWPELQIIRNLTDIVFSTNTSKPKPMGYLNVYEYNLSAVNFQVEPRDVLNISWYDAREQSQQVRNRFSLAYYNNGTSPSIPMVSIIVGDCDPETDLLKLNTLYCEEVSEPTIYKYINQTNKSESEINLSTTEIITGVVVFSLFLLITLIISVAVFTLVVKRRRKAASLNAIDSTEMNNQPQMLYNTPSKSTDFGNSNF